VLAPEKHDAKMRSDQKKKKQIAPHLRRLRTLVPSKRKKLEKQDLAPSTAAKRAAAAEPDAVRRADAESLEPHPVSMFVRGHTPIKFCGRCSQCRMLPCGKCTNCQNNAHLAERSRDRKKCITNGCCKLTPDELRRYRLAHDASDAISLVEDAMRKLRDRCMAVQVNVAGTSAGEIQQMKTELDRLTLQMEDLQETRSEVEDAPEGFEAIYLSMQMLETERDRLARLVDRRTTRDSPQVMRTRRQLRNYYGLFMCSIANMFGNDMVAPRYVPKLRETATKYEAFVRGIMDL
jgi:hypothetical protein